MVRAPSTTMSEIGGPSWGRAAAGASSARPRTTQRARVLPHLSLDRFLRRGDRKLDIELEAVVGDFDHNFVPRGEATLEQFLGQRILEVTLDRSLERPRAVLVVEPLLGEELLRPVGQDEFESAILEPADDVAEEDVDDRLDVLQGERMEDDRLVDAVQELGIERLVDLVLDRV